MNRSEEIYLTISTKKDEKTPIIDQIFDLIKEDYKDSKFSRAQITSKVQSLTTLKTIKLTKIVEDLCASSFGCDYTDEQFDSLMEREKLLFQIKETFKLMKSCKKYNKKKTA